MCPKCGVEKWVSEFNRDNKRKDRKQPYCRECNRALGKVWHNKNTGKTATKSRKSNLKRNYGLTLEAYDALKATQKGRCAICGVDKPGGGKKNMPVDHDHKTGKVRALLCSRCNVRLGHIEQDTPPLEKYLKYIRKHKEVTIA